VIVQALSTNALMEALESLRKRLDTAFRSDTAAQGFAGSTPSAGHCAAVAVIVRELLGGDTVSTHIDGHSHWLNRIRVAGRSMDVDLTGDQFGRPGLQMADAGTLYPETRVRSRTEVTTETLARALVLAQRADLTEAVVTINAQLETLSPTRGSKSR
jgi:hypothetical protein